MELAFDTNDIEKYHSRSQVARVLTEKWIHKNMYCPRCGNVHISQFENNRPVADFHCPNCNSEYELKSKNGQLGHKIADGAYGTMIERINSNNNPDFLFMSYSDIHYTVSNLILVPKHFFVPEIIEKRKPLSDTARRAGWVGCNILIEKIPIQGRISIVSNGKIIDAKQVMKKVTASSTLETKNMESRGWLMDVLNCVNKAPTPIFSLDDIYAFEPQLQYKYPENRNIRPKIRQQLQLLRDKGFIEFLGRGNYKKLI